MKTKTKILVSILSILGFFIFSSLLCCYFLFFHHYKGSNPVNEWSAADEFNIESIKTIEKDKNKDFVILNLADVQMCDLEDLFHASTIHSEISYLVEQTKPDLITLTGDQTWSNENLISLRLLISWLDGYKIPYAPVFGNHDYGNRKNSAVASQNYCCDLYERGRYSLFSRGPSNLGTLGNYVVNIVEDGKIFKTLYMIDSGYEEKITDQQIEWLKWNAEGIKKANNNATSEGMCFMHKPLPEYAQAYNDYLSGDVEAIGEVFVSYSLAGSLQNGFFEAAKEWGVKDIVCGHQHGNNFTLLYQDVRLTFALKTGELGGYYYDGQTNLNGATYFVLGEQTQVKNIFVSPTQFHIKDSEFNPN